MNRQDTCTAGSDVPAPITTGWALVRHVREMALLWLALGALAGPCLVPPGGGWVSLVSWGIAGMVVLTPVGVLLGLLGGRRRDSVACGLGGLAVGALAGVARAGAV